MQVNRKDLASGAFFTGVGLLYGITALTSLPFGNALDMGPGYFPALLSLVLVIFGILIAARSLVVPQKSPFGRVPWRALVLLSLSTIVFAAFFDDLGMLPGTFVSTFIAVMAGPRIGLVKAAAISLGIAICCTAVFGLGIKIPVPVIGPAFGSLSFRAI